jgi:hypothetical protein
VADDKCCAKGPDEGYTDRWNNARNPGVNKPAASLEPATTPKVDLSRPVSKMTNAEASNFEKKRIEAAATAMNRLPPSITATTGVISGPLISGYEQPDVSRPTGLMEQAKAQAERDAEKFKPVGYAKGGYTQRWSKARGN